MERLSNQQILDAGLTDWRKLSQPLQARYVIPNLAEAARFVAAVAEAADAESRHLDVRLAHGVVDLSLCTHEDGLWVTQKDIDLARKISSIAQTNGLVADPAASVSQRHDAARVLDRFRSITLERSPLPPLSVRILGMLMLTP